MHQTVPGGLGEAGRRAYLGTLGRNLRIAERTRELLDAAETAGLPLMPYKGVFLADALYPDPGMRPMSDVDLLVPPSAVEAVDALVTGLGFERNYADRLRFSSEHAHDRSYTDRRGGDLVIEVHHRLFHELGGDASVEPLFARAITVETLGRPRRVPSWDDHLFAVAVHAATHAFGDHPTWIFDVMLLAERAGGISGAADEAARRRLSVAFSAAMAIAQPLVPGLASSTPATGLRAQLLARVLGGEPLSRAPERWRSLLVRALLTDDPLDAVRAVARKSALRFAEVGERLRR